MSASAMVPPLAALVFVTFLLALNLLHARSRAVSAGTMRMSHFKALQGGPVPEPVAVAERAFQNALEVPPLFYVAGVAAMALNAVDGTLVALAWVFVALRVAQAGIHLTYNNVMHRFYTYMAGWLILLAVWAKLVLVSL